MRSVIAMVACLAIAFPALAQLELEISADFYWEVGFKDDDCVDEFPDDTELDKFGRALASTFDDGQVNMSELNEFTFEPSDFDLILIEIDTALTVIVDEPYRPTGPSLLSFDGGPGGHAVTFVTPPGTNVSEVFQFSGTGPYGVLFDGDPGTTFNFVGTQTVFRVNPGTTFCTEISNVNFANLTGSIFEGASGALFLDNVHVTRGGSAAPMFDLQGDVDLKVRNSRIVAGPSDQFGCVANADNPSGQMHFTNNMITSARCTSSTFDAFAGTRAKFLNNTMHCGGACINTVTPPTILGGNVMNSIQGLAVNQFGSGVVETLGGNLSCPNPGFPPGPGDAICSGPADFLGPVPGFYDLLEQELDEQQGTWVLNPVPTLRPNDRDSYVDFGLATVPKAATFELPCGNIDRAGKGRPQDASGTGEFRCDRGAFEEQAGPDIGAPASAAYFDPDRPGEGAFVEVLNVSDAAGRTRAFTGFFGFDEDGERMWLTGVGYLAGNTLVFERMDRPSGGVHGAGFDSDDISLQYAGTMSMIFPTCEAVEAEGRLAFAAGNATGLTDLFSPMSRLSTIVGCDGATGANAGRSGAFFDPGRNGEGVFVQALNDGRILLIWWTFDADGDQFWMISDNATISGDTITANMLYAASTTRFGAEFDPDQIVLDAAGTITLRYADDNSARFEFAPSAVLSGMGFGNVGYDYVRLTRLAGT